MGVTRDNKRSCKKAGGRGQFRVPRVLFYGAAEKGSGTLRLAVLCRESPDSGDCLVLREFKDARMTAQIMYGCELPQHLRAGTQGRTRTKRMAGFKSGNVVQSEVLPYFASAYSDLRCLIEATRRKLGINLKEKQVKAIHVLSRWNKISMVRGTIFLNFGPALKNLLKH